MSRQAPVFNRKIPSLFTREGESFSYIPTVLGSVDRFEASPLPSGFSVDTNTGEISSLSAVAGLHTITHRAILDDAREFVVDTGTDVCTSTGHPFEDGDLVVPTSSTTLPAPLVSGNVYEVQNSAADTFQLSSRVGGPVVNFTDTGTGTHEITVELVDEMFIRIPVELKESVVDVDTPDIEFRFDYLSKEVTIPGTDRGMFTAPAAELRDDGLAKPVYEVSVGERFPVAIPVISQGLRKDLNIVSLDVTGKEFDPESPLSITDGTFEKVGSGRSAFWRVVFDFTSAAWASVASNYEDDRGTYFFAICQIQLGILKAAEAFSANETKALLSDMSSASSETLSFSFADLPQFATPTAFELLLSLTVSGRTAQNVAFTRTFDLEYVSGQVLTGAAGDTTGSGTDEGVIHWRSTLTLASLAATATGIDFDVDVDASVFVAITTIVIDCNDAQGLEVTAGGVVTNDPAITSWEYEGREIGGTTLPFLLEDGQSFATIEAALDTALKPDLSFTIDEVFGDVGNNLLIISFTTGGTFEQVEYLDQGYGSGLYDRSTDSGASRSATVKATVQTEGAGDSYTRTSEKMVLLVQTNTKG